MLRETYAKEYATSFAISQLRMKQIIVDYDTGVLNNVEFLKRINDETCRYASEIAILQADYIESLVKEHSCKCPQE